MILWIIVHLACWMWGVIPSEESMAMFAFLSGVEMIAATPFIICFAYAYLSAEYEFRQEIKKQKRLQELKNAHV